MITHRLWFTTLPGISIFAVAVFLLVVFAHSASASSLPLTKTYTNAAWGFTLQMSEDFTIYPADGEPQRDESGAPMGQALVLQNGAGSVIQFEITQDTREKPSNVITVDEVAAEYPYIDPADMQTVEIMPGVTGVTFTEVLGSESVTDTDVLIFTYRGNLYEISSEMSIRPLAETILSSLTFN